MCRVNERNNNNEIITLFGPAYASAALSAAAATCCTTFKWSTARPSQYFRAVAPRLSKLSIGRPAALETISAESGRRNKWLRSAAVRCHNEESNHCKCDGQAGATSRGLSERISWIGSADARSRGSQFFTLNCTSVTRRSIAIERRLVAPDTGEGRKNTCCVRRKRMGRLGQLELNSKKCLLRGAPTSSQASD